MSFRIFIFLGALLASAGFASAQECDRATLPVGFTIGDLKGIAPAEGFVCYEISVPQGQNVSIELASGRNVAITVPGHYDARIERMYLGDLPGRLELRVFQLMRSVTPEPFAVRIRFEPPGNG